MTDIQAKLLEEKLLRGIRAKRRFRAAIKHVIHNRFWMQEDDEFFDTDNVRQTISRLKRKKRIKKGLTIREKAILRKKLEYRTEEEKKNLNKVIGGLKCFRSYPENVQNELVAVSFFEFYPAGRLLIRQNDEARAMFYILTGEVIITKTLKDEITNEFVEVEIARIYAGSIFGEISLVHNVPRTATVTTAGPCELLVIKKQDFDRVLKKSLWQKWEESRNAMLKFMYFDQWSSISLKECCILSRMKSYEPNQIVYGDGKNRKGAQRQTYFLIEGKCSIVEHMFVKETVRLGVRHFKLYEPPAEMEDDIQSTVNMFAKDFGDDITTASSVKTDKSDETSMQVISDGRFESVRDSKSRNKSSRFSIMSLKHLLEKQQKEKTENILQKQREFLPPNVGIKFLQICILREKGTFMDCELMKNRRVITLTPCTFLVVPTYWLFQHNKGNVWVRLEKFLQRTLPSTEKVFETYVRNQRWLDYKKKLRNATVEEKKFYNKTTIHDVPYSIRVKNRYE